MTTAKLHELVKELEAEAISKETQLAAHQAEVQRLVRDINEIRKVVNMAKKALGIPIPPSDAIKITANPKPPILLPNEFDVPPGAMRCPFAVQGCEFFTSKKNAMTMHVKYKHAGQPFPTKAMAVTP